MDVAQQFRAMLREVPPKSGEISAFLDGLDHDGRVAAIRATSRSDQRRLYEAMAGAGIVTLCDLVPPDREPLATVRHHGMNTLPLFNHFEKRFCRAPGQDPDTPQALLGFNFQRLGPITGPGYFVARDDPERGEVAIDYTRIPDVAPPDWPPIRRNDRGLSRFVYGFMLDTLRSVSEHVTIGSAARNGRDLGSWFLLCREP